MSIFNIRTKTKHRSVVGVVCEHNRLSITWFSGGAVRKYVCVDVGENIARGSDILAPGLFSSLLRDTLKENGIKCKHAAYAIPGETVFTRTITMPRMADEQVRLNIPFEFRDFISGELKDYVFDYSYIRNGAGVDDSGEPVVKVFAAALPKGFLSDTIAMFSAAGLRLVKAAPELSSYEALLSLLPTEEEQAKERCFLDIGRNHTRMLIYKDHRYKLMHMIDIGESAIIRNIADEKNVDMHIAATYLRTKFEDCDKLPSVISAYKDISLEVMKSINFYEVSDMSARLRDLTICGEGAQIEPLVDLLKTRIAMNVTTMDELLPEWNKDGLLALTAPSLGLVLDAGKDPINFIGVGETPTNWKYAAPGIAIILIAAALFSKFAVVDRYQKLWSAQAKAAHQSELLNEGYQKLKDSEELLDRYGHYTWSYMTEEERTRRSRVEVDDLVTFIASQVLSVNSFSLSEDLLTVSISAPTLESISRLSMELERRDMVESASMPTAQTTLTENGVDAQLVVYLSPEESK